MERQKSQYGIETDQMQSRKFVTCGADRVAELLVLGHGHLLVSCANEHDELSAVATEAARGASNAELMRALARRLCDNKNVSLTGSEKEFIAQTLNDFERLSRIAVAALKVQA